MKMQDYASAFPSDVESYRAATSFELAGKELTYTLDNGAAVALAFAKYPRKELYFDGNADAVRYDCVKISEQVLYITYVLPEIFVAYVLDMESGRITRIVTGNNSKTTINFGTASGSKDYHTFTDDLRGNTVRWTLGKKGASIFLTGYGDGATRVSRPFAADAPDITVTDSRIVRITEYIYLHIVSAHINGRMLNVNSVCNFYNLTCSGSIYDLSAAVSQSCKSFSGYGRIMSEYETDGVDLRALCPFYSKGGITQYAAPRCFELSGERFELAMDDGYDYTLDFLDGETLEWTQGGNKPGKACYLCDKGDDFTYLVSFELSGASPRVNHAFVIDRENNLVTRLISKIGFNPKYPYLIKTEYEFGVIRQDGVEVNPYPRHGFTDDVVGTAAQWACGSKMASVHAYYCSDFYRITYTRDPAFLVDGKVTGNMFTSDDIPSTDEPCTFIKIKDGMYLFTLTEENMEKVLGAKLGFRSNTMNFLQNFKTVRSVIRAFGTSTPPEGDDIKTHLMFTAYGKLVDADIDEGLRKLFSDPNPFLI